MTTIGIIGAGEVGSHVARAAIASGYKVVIANSRGPETLERLIEELGPSARAASATGAAAAGEFVVVAVPLKLVNDMPATELAGKVVIDTNNYMAWRDGHYPIVERGEKTEHELRQEQLPASKVVNPWRNGGCAGCADQAHLAPMRHKSLKTHDRTKPHLARFYLAIVRLCCLLLPPLTPNPRQSPTMPPEVRS